MATSILGILSHLCVALLEDRHLLWCEAAWIAHLWGLHLHVRRALLHPSGRTARRHAWSLVDLPIRHSLRHVRCALWDLRRGVAASLLWNLLLASLSHHRIRHCSRLRSGRATGTSTLTRCLCHGKAALGHHRRRVHHRRLIPNDRARLSHRNLVGIVLLLALHHASLLWMSMILRIHLRLLLRRCHRLRAHSILLHALLLLQLHRRHLLLLVALLLLLLHHQLTLPLSVSSPLHRRLLIFCLLLLLRRAILLFFPLSLLFFKLLPDHFYSLEA